MIYETVVLVLSNEAKDELALREKCHQDFFSVQPLCVLCACSEKGSVAEGHDYGSARDTQRLGQRMVSGF